MSPLATKGTVVLGIESFNMNSLFFTDSNLFNMFKINENEFLVLEKICAVFLLILLLPLLLTISILIRLTMGKGIFYKQIRVGQNGKPFLIYKFRSMITDAERTTGPILSCANDTRVTRLGKILRTSHIDEFPQLINVLKGEMSFIGPRPERPEFVEQFSQRVPGYNRRHTVKPGITGLAQICLPYDASAKEKLEYDNFYIENRQSVLFNFMISFYTCLKMISI